MPTSQFTPQPARVQTPVCGCCTNPFCHLAAAIREQRFQAFLDEWLGR